MADIDFKNIFLLLLSGVSFIFSIYFGGANLGWWGASWWNPSSINLPILSTGWFLFGWGAICFFASLLGAFSLAVDVKFRNNSGQENPPIISIWDIILFIISGGTSIIEFIAEKISASTVKRIGEKTKLISSLLSTVSIIGLVFFMIITGWAGVMLENAGIDIEGMTGDLDLGFLETIKDAIGDLGDNLGALFDVFGGSQGLDDLQMTPN